MRQECEVFGPKYSQDLHKRYCKLNKGITYFEVPLDTSIRRSKIIGGITKSPSAVAHYDASD